jgi:aconitate hydratase
MYDSFSTRRRSRRQRPLETYFSLRPWASASTSAGLPYSMKILLENLLRHEDGGPTSAGAHRVGGDVDAGPSPTPRFAFMPARVVLQDFTGCVVVDLAAMRDAVTRLGGSPKQINPLIPSELVIDHSVQVDVFGRADALDSTARSSSSATRREQLPALGRRLRQLQVVPPNTAPSPGELEHLAASWSNATSTANCRRSGYRVRHRQPYHDDQRHRRARLGVGGSEAEAAMLGQPSSMLIPQVVGFKLTGRLPEGSNRHDLVLTVTQMRALGVVGKFVEFYGDGLQHLPLGRPRHRSPTWRRNTVRPAASSRSMPRR